VNAAVFVLSTGRCGTQWLARFLQASLGDAATVTHEPLHNDWSPREMLAAGNPDRLGPDRRETIEQHLAVIRQVLRERTYIECGHPTWGAMPYLIEAFAPQIRVIHLVRHPVPTAWSWVTHRAFCPPLVPYLPEKILVSPFDPGTEFTEYRERWSSMSPYEKSLYYWLEVNAFCCRLQAAGKIPWLRLSFDAMFDSATQRSLLAFAGSARGSIEGRVPGLVDELRHLTELRVEPEEIERHPAVLRLAAEFGFDGARFDAARLRRRYSAI
jgi:hypothetical protein